MGIVVEKNRLLWVVVECMVFSCLRSGPLSERYP